MIIKHRKKFRKIQSKINVIANNGIFCREMRVIASDGSSLGVLSKQEALRKAYESDLDLILITNKTNPPVAKITELSKYKYQLGQKLAESRKKSKIVSIKEIRITPFIGENDLNLKIKKIKEFLTKNQKVKLSMEFKGRSIEKKDFGNKIFEKILEAVEDDSQIEILPKLIGKKMISQLMPIKKRKKNA